MYRKHFFSFSQNLYDLQFTFGWIILCALRKSKVKSDGFFIISKSDPKLMPMPKLGPGKKFWIHNNDCRSARNILTPK